MTTPAALPLVTTEQLLSLPRYGTMHELIRGRLRERPTLYHSRLHARSAADVAYFLTEWLLQQPEPRGEMLSGEPGFILQRDPDTAVGIDLAFISADLARSTPENALLIEGLPALAVEILSPSTPLTEVLDKVEMYLEVGVPLVWLIEPRFRTVTVYTPGQEPVLFNATQELSGDPHLKGFRVAVADLFRA